MKSFKLLALVGISMFVASAPVRSFQLQHEQGTLRLPSVPTSVVSFDLGVLDTLAVLDVPVAGVPRSTYEGALARYKNAPVVGTLFEPDYDVLKQLEPNLIIASRRASSAVPELIKLAPTVSMPNDPSAFLAGFRQANLALGAAFGKQSQAEAALAVIDKNVEKLHAINKGKKAGFLFVVKGNVIPHVPGDRFGYAYELAGMQSVLPARDPNAPVAPRPEPGSPQAKAAVQERDQAVQAIAEAQPDWLIVLDRGAINGAEKTAAATLAAHPQLSQTQAFKKNRVYYVDPNGWYVIGGGLSNLRRITEDMLEAMKSP